MFKHEKSTVTKCTSTLENSSKSSTYIKWDILKSAHLGWNWNSSRVVCCYINLDKYSIHNLDILNLILQNWLCYRRIILHFLHLDSHHIEDEPSPFLHTWWFKLKHWRIQYTYKQRVVFSTIRERNDTFCKTKTKLTQWCSLQLWYYHC